MLARGLRASRSGSNNQSTTFLPINLAGEDHLPTHGVDQAGRPLVCHIKRLVPDDCIRTVCCAVQATWQYDKSFRRFTQLNHRLDCLRPRLSMALRSWPYRFQLDQLFIEGLQSSRHRPRCTPSGCASAGFVGCPRMRPSTSTTGVNPAKVPVTKASSAP
jgi:hypothetical protein